MKFTCKWSTRSAFFQLNHDDIIKRTVETSGIQPGKPGFLGALQRETTATLDALPPGVLNDYVKYAKEWTTKTPPHDVQSRSLNLISCMFCTDRFLYHRMATSMRKRIIHDFQSQLFKTCGIRTLVLTAYEGEDQELKVGMCVIQVFSILQSGTHGNDTVQR